MECLAFGSVQLRCLVSSIHHGLGHLLQQGSYGDECLSDGGHPLFCVLLDLVLLHGKCIGYFLDELLLFLLELYSIVLCFSSECNQRLLDLIDCSSVVLAELLGLPGEHVVVGGIVWTTQYDMQ